MSAVRLAVAALLVGATAVVARAMQTSPREAAPPVVPYTIGAWKGVEGDPIDAETKRATAADAILNRTYSDADGSALDLYLAYYAGQTPGAGIHSPLHCLPGTGWDILENRAIDVNLFDGTAGPLRRLIAQKGDSRVLVMYWYSIHGRMIANELASRWRLLNDRIRLGRNDGSLVRLVVPVTGSDSVSERRGLQFARALVPYL